MASTPRQDKVLHGVAKAVNVVFGLFALPVWLFGQKASGPLRDLLDRRGAANPPQLPVPPGTPGEPPTVDAVMSDLESVPMNLRANVAKELRLGLADLSTFVLSQQAAVTGLGYSYPSQFSPQVFEGADGERISAQIALHSEPRPALVVVHGVFTSSRFDYVRKVAVRAFYEWGFNVAAIDLRSFGTTELTTSAPSTAGWKEGEDLIALARHMRGLGSTSVGALGISLGGSSVLGACHPEGAEALDGGILAVSPPADPKAVAARLSRKLPRMHPAWALNYGFHAMLTSRVRGARWPTEVQSLPDAMSVLAPPFYGISADEIWSRAAAVNHIAAAKVPVLVLHPEDDQIIKVEQAELLREAAADNGLVRVWRLPAGSHGALDAMDPRWTFTVYRRWFESWATYPGSPAGNRGNGKLIYSD